MASKDKEKERYYRIYLDSKGKLRDAWGRFLGKWKDIDTYKKPEEEILQVNRKTSRIEFKKLAMSNVCEIVYVCRRPERRPGRPEVRRMICAVAGINSYNPVLTTIEGQRELGFHYPITSRRLDEVKHDITVVWDIIMQDYRNVSMEECYIRQIIPNDAFWKYFRDTLSQLTVEQRLQFIDSYD